MASSGVSSIELGRGLRAAREAADCTQKTAAEHLGVARTTLVAIEKGERRVRPEELVALAALYEEPVSALVRETAVVPDLSLQFRRNDRADAGDPDTLTVIRLLRRLAGTAVELEQRFGAPRARRLPAEWVPVRGQLREQGEDLAQEVRRMLGVGGGSPIDRLAERLEDEFGVRIFLRPIPSTIAGAFAYSDEIGPFILVNSLHPRTRQRWTIAHELGHFMTSRYVVDVLRLDEDIHERIADYFAAALLLPAREMRARVRDRIHEAGKFTPRDLMILARVFVVSLEAASRRLEGIGLLAKGTIEHLQSVGVRSTEMVGPLDGSSEPAQVSSPTAFAMLALRGYERDELSEGQVADLLGLDRISVRDLLDKFGRPELSDDLST